MPVFKTDEQTKAIIQWLNHRTEWKTEFIVLKLEIFKIEDFLPAIRLMRT